MGLVKLKIKPGGQIDINFVFSPPEIRTRKKKKKIKMKEKKKGGKTSWRLLFIRPT